MSELPRENIIRLAGAAARLARFTPDDPAEYAFAVHFMHTCGRHVEALIALERAGCLDSAAGVARSTFEIASTAIWMVQDLGPRLEQLMRAQRYDIKQLTDLNPAYVPLLDELDQILDTNYGDHNGRKIKGVSERIRDIGLNDVHYLRYRDLCLRAHPTIVGSTVGRPDPATHELERHYLAYAAWITATLTTLVHHRFNSPDEGVSAQLGVTLGRIADGLELH